MPFLRLLNTLTVNSNTRNTYKSLNTKQLQTRKKKNGYILTELKQVF